QVLGYALPVNLNAALVAQRDSTLEARELARRAGAMKNNVPSLILAETVLLTAEGALRAGDLARAASGYVSAIPQYRKAQQEAEELRREAQLALTRATASERVANLQVLMPGMAAKDVTGWETFFQRYIRLTARYSVERLSARGDTAYAAVRTAYTFVPAGGGGQRETRLRQAIRFLK